MNVYVVICCRMYTNSGHLGSNNRSNVRIVSSNTKFVVFLSRDDGALVKKCTNACEECCGMKKYWKCPGILYQKNLTHFFFIVDVPCASVYVLTNSTIAQCVTTIIHLWCFHMNSIGCKHHCVT